MLDGTAIKDAVEIGKNNESNTKKCQDFYVKCPVNKENVVEIASSLLPSSKNDEEHQNSNTKKQEYHHQYGQEKTFN